MVKKIVIIGACLAAFLVLNFFGKAYIRRRNAMSVVRAVLTCWEENNIPQSYKYWEDEKNSPPVYDLMTHEIGKAAFEKKDGIYNATVEVKLYFPTGHALPSGKIWTFALHKTPYGWKVVDFRRMSPQ